MCNTFECLPYAGGWAEQPHDIIVALAVFKIEQNRIENEQIEAAKNSR